MSCSRRGRGPVGGSPGCPRFFLNLDDGLCLFESMFKAPVLSLQLSHPLCQRVLRLFFPAPFLRTQGPQLPLITLPAPCGQVRKVQALAPKQPPNLTGCGTRIGFFENPKLVLGGESAPRLLLHNLGVGSLQPPADRGNSSRPTDSFRYPDVSLWSLVLWLCHHPSSPTRPTLIFQGVGVSLSLAQRAPPAKFEEQYRDRLKLLKEHGILEAQAPFWALEAQCRKVIGDAILGERLVLPGRWSMGSDLCVLP